MAAGTGLKSLLQQNPFPEGHPYHAAYVRWARLVVEGQARLAADYGERLLKTPPGQTEELQAEMIGAMLDHWVHCYFPAARGLPPEQFMEIIEQFANQALDVAGQLVSTGDGWSRGAPPLVRGRVLQRKAFWMAAALKASREAEQDRSRSDGIQTSTRDVAERTAKADRRAAIVGPLLRAKGLTPAQWAGLAGLDPSVAYDYLAGKSNPRPQSRTALAGVLKIPLHDLPQ